ncbi:MAG: phospholipid/cholesterol/gamma-HCH transport system substrate-binding protein [Myxococcota bacterium]
MSVPKISNEFKVGLFVISAVLIGFLAWMWTFDGVRKDEGAYALYLTVPSADGLWKGTSVKLAGVDVGAIERVEVQGAQARLTLLVREAYQLPVDSKADLRSSGLLGDRYVAVIPGEEEPLLQDGSVIQLKEPPADIEQITRNVQHISEDVQAITSVLREMIENDDNTDAIEATLQNVEGLTAEVESLVSRNSRDIDAIVDSVARLTATLEGFAVDVSADVDQEMDQLQEATETLQGALSDIESITGKMDDGQGTIGALINDSATIDAINDTVENVNEVVEGFSGLQAEVYYTGRYYFGTQPNDPAFYYGNPLAPNLNGGIGSAGANTVGVRLSSMEDFWYLFEIVDHPQGTVDWTETYAPEIGEVYTEWVRKPAFRMTFQLEKRWGNFSFRLGIKESGGGVGMTWYLAKDRVQIQADVFDFDLGAFPALASRGTPNNRFLVRWEPISKIYAEVGTEQVLLQAQYGYVNAFGGVGFHFNDNDIKLLLATLPLGL